MQIWKIAVCLMVIPMISMIGNAWVFSFDWWSNASGNATIPGQDFVQSIAVNSVDLTKYYFTNDSIAIAKSDINDIADVQPLVYYNNASNMDLTFYLNSTGSIGLNDVCEVYIKPLTGLTAKLTPDILQNYGRPINNTAYFLAIKYLKQQGECKFKVVTS